MNTEIITISSIDELEYKLEHPSSVIKSGGLVVFPTETVYGLGADGTNAEAAEKVYRAKGRPSDNPLIIHIAAPDWAEKYAHTNDTYYKLADAFMPGPLTVVLDAKDTVPLKTRGGLSTVAVRCPSNIIARKLRELSGVPIAAPSANLSGSPSPTRSSHVIDDMMGRVDIIIDGGDCDFGLESTIVKIDSLGSVTLLRPGKITVDDIKRIGVQIEVADAVLNELKPGEVAESPGMKYRHYAPTSPLVLYDCKISKLLNYIKAENKKTIAIVSFSEDVELINNSIANADVFDFGKRCDAIGQAHVLFSILRETDKKNYDCIYAPLPEINGIGLALYNRMIRAAAHNILKL